MARPARPLAHGLTYHAMARGNNRQAIFGNDLEARSFLACRGRPASLRLDDPRLVPHAESCAPALTGFPNLSQGVRDILGGTPVATTTSTSGRATSSRLASVRHRRLRPSVPDHVQIRQPEPRSGRARVSTRPLSLDWLRTSPFSATTGCTRRSQRPRDVASASRHRRATAAPPCPR